MKTMFKLFLTSLFVLLVWLFFSTIITALNIIVPLQERSHSV